MSLVAVGIDLADVHEVLESVRQFGSRYLTRIYTAEEIRYAESSPGHYGGRLAARFAAKEAVIKLLRPEDEAIPWHDIEIRRSHSGGCDVLLSGAALCLAERNGIDQISVSLTHQGRSAVAVASALRNPPGAGASAGTDRRPPPTERD